MQLHFEPDLDYQIQAIEAVCGLFHGQETCRTEFTVTRDAGGQMSLLENDLGIGNRLTLLDEELLANLHAIQLRHGLAPSVALASGDFTVEMETGTGKTYVYLRTVFELNKRYGFTKFVIVVPSVAIKEGVYHTIETAAEHLKGLYAGTPFEFFIYESAKLGQVRNFATSPQIQIMVMTVGAINKFGDERKALAEEADEAARREKSKNVMYRASEKTGGENGERLRGFERNTLTVIATESYEQFAEKLQKEIEDETGIRFGIVETHQFAGVTATGADGQPVPLGFEQSNQTLFKEVDLTIAAEDVHNGYFSIDRKKVGGKTVEMFKDSKGEGTTRADDDTYSLIMRDKEKLLSFETPLKFIFSHSALREGWDNPNVFQICALREMASEQQRRQTIGRGLRLCVNQNGERLRGFERNTLTVIATESYEQFAEKLQKEIEDENSCCGSI